MGLDRWGSALAGEGSNLQHPAPKAGVLPIELPAKGLVRATAPERGSHSPGIIVDDRLTPR